ncbi:dethiobiotin synthase [Magnetofaba australis]|uniref:dethiobiotin synthase n=1 Tax=Magnetofaba australis TaxID=1472297 RepID=UPI000A19D350
MQRGVFVTGTDTGIGKSVVSAWLARRYGADYWKPVQSGLAGETDSQLVARLAELAPERVHPERYRLREPLSPHAAAERDGVTLDLGDFHLPETSQPLVVEGAGGALVPLNGAELMVDLMVHLGLPVMVAARNRLGVINQVLMTLEVLRSRDLSVLGVILTGEENRVNEEAIEQHGRTAILARIPWMEPLTPQALLAASMHFDSTTEPY